MENAQLRLPSSKLKGIRLVVCDMDGTALNSSKEFSKAALNAFSQLKENGIMYTIASARTPMMLGVFCMQCGIVNVPIITLEGALILDWQNRLPLYARPIDASAALEIIRYCHDSGLDYTIYTDENSVLRRNTRRMWRFEKYNDLADRYGVPLVKTAIYEELDAGELAEDGIYKVFVDNPGERQRSELNCFLKDFHHIRTDCSEGRSVSIMHDTVSKGNALKALSKRLGLLPEEICCFGDWYNDIDMLSSFPNSVAMVNGAQEARDAARYVTLSNDDDGVAYMITQYIL